MVKELLQNDQSKVLWENARDSIKHALEHFSELSICGSKDELYNKKWIVLSVHHAAEIFCYMLLKEFDENNSAFYKKGNHYYPGLDKTIRVLLHINNNFGLASFEKYILELFRRLSDSRDKIMHGEIPEQIDISISAMSIIGMSKISKKRCKETADDIYQQYPSIQRDVAEAIRANKVEEYTKFIENYVREILGYIWIPQCPNCAGYTILHGHCEACFEEIREIECPECQEEIFVICSYPFDQDCPECGRVAVSGES